MRKKKTISTFVVSMLLEIKTVLSSDRTKNMDSNRIVSHFNNFKSTFTPLEKVSKLNLNEPSSYSVKSNAKRIKSQYEIRTKKIKPNSTLLSQKKIVSYGFCSISGHRTTVCSLKKKYTNKNIQILLNDLHLRLTTNSFRSSHLQTANALVYPQIYIPSYKLIKPTSR